MSRTVFISYRHSQAEWVRTRLAPVIRASGAPVILDVIDGQAGRSLDAQMTDWVDRAAHVVAVLSPDYFDSDACRLEWDRAMGRDPGFLNGGMLVPVLRETVDPMPAVLTGTGAPLYLDLRRDGQGRADGALEMQWQKLLVVWGGTLGTPVTAWLDALRDIVRDLQDRKHVSLVAGGKTAWPRLLDEVRLQLAPDPLGVVNVADPETWERAGFLECTLAALGVTATLERGNARADIAGFSRRVRALPEQRLLFKNLQKITDFPDFGTDLFDALRFHAMDDGRNLTLLVHTTEPFGGLLPKGHVLSQMTFTQVHLTAGPR